MAIEGLVKVRRVGNSLTVTLPPQFAAAIGVDRGDVVAMTDMAPDRVVLWRAPDYYQGRIIEA